MVVYGNPRWGSFWMVIRSVSALNFVSVTPSMGILFPILRRNKVMEDPERVPSEMKRSEAP
jgi:hypothetical protein